jgi:hypothetical protein
MFKFKAQATKVMVKQFDMNLVTELWVTITNNSLLCQHLNEYMKLTKVAIVFVFSLVEDQHIFFIFAFMKDKLCNQLG